MAFFGGDQNDIFNGTDEDELIRGGGGNDSLDGSFGNDTLNGEQGIDYLAGGPGDDTYLFRLGQGGLGPFAIELVDELAFGSGGIDVLQLIDYSVESLRVRSQTVDGVSYFYFGATNDPDFSTGVFVHHNPEGGEDFWDFVEGIQLDGGHIRSTIVPFDFILTGNNGTIRGTRGDDVMRVDDADGTGSVQFYGYAGNDTLLGGTENARLEGGIGNDSLVGGSGSIGSSLFGQAGNDTLDSGGSRGTLDGGPGSDTYFVRQTRVIIAEDARDDGVDRAFTFVDYDLLRSDVEVLILAGDDDLNATASTFGTFISANLGNNHLIGAQGNDRLEGRGGDDTLEGFGGNDTLRGGPGSDTYIVRTSDELVAESRSHDGVDSVTSLVDFRMGRSHIENLTLSESSTVALLGAGNGLQNVITGNQFNNILDGGKNVDTLIGGEGDDIYLIRAPGDNAVELAGEGIDTVRAFRAHELDANVENLHLQTLRNAAGDGVAGINGFGNNLDNQIVGNPFENILAGREGNDTLRGQGGADTFVFDRAIGADNIDRIIDFDAAEGDLLKFKQAEFATVARGALDAAAFIDGTAAADAGDRFIFDQAAGRLFFDVDGTGSLAQQLVATFDGGAVVTASDIEIF